MKNKSQIYNQEIDLISLIEIVWNGKIKILLITIISFCVGFGYSLKVPNNYLNSLTINLNDTHKLMQLHNLEKLIEINKSDRLSQYKKLDKTNRYFLNKFVDELKDYEEFLFYLKNTQKIRENISKLQIKDIEKYMFKFSKLFEVNSNTKEGNFTINFIWHDPDEVMKVLKDTLDLTSDNLKKNIYNEFEQNLEFEKKLNFTLNSKKLNFLKEQSIIAKELNIAENQKDAGYFSQPTGNIDIYNSAMAYYLRGYKAIDKEIELIQKRDYQNFKLIEQELNKFKNSEISFVNYNIYLMETKSVKNTKLILIISIFLGLIAGVLYVFISNLFLPLSLRKK